MGDAEGPCGPPVAVGPGDSATYYPGRPRSDQLGPSPTRDGAAVFEGADRICGNGRSTLGHQSGVHRGRVSGKSVAALHALLVELLGREAAAVREWIDISGADEASLPKDHDGGSTGGGRGGIRRYGSADVHAHGERSEGGGETDGDSRSPDTEAVSRTG